MDPLRRRNVLAAESGHRRPAAHQRAMVPTDSDFWGSISNLGLRCGGPAKLEELRAVFSNLGAATAANAADCTRED